MYLYVIFVYFLFFWTRLPESDESDGNTTIKEDCIDKSNGNKLICKYLRQFFCFAEEKHCGQKHIKLLLL